MEPDSPIEPPPPAYDAEHDFDRKTSDALERSLTIANLIPQSISSQEDEVWEEWDEAAFEAAAARAREQEGGGGGSNIQALPLSRAASEKRRLASHDAIQTGPAIGEGSNSSSSNAPRTLPSSPFPTKQRPSWLDIPDGSGSSSRQYERPPVSSHVHHLPPEENDPGEALPPFAAVAPSLEGPPFEEVMRQPHRLMPVTDADSPPQSPLDSVEDADIHHDTSPTYPDLSHRGPALSRPSRTPPSSSAIPPVRPSSSRPPTMSLNTPIAYANATRQRQLNAALNGSESREPIDASALYHASVSSLLKARQSPVAPKQNNSVSSTASGSVNSFRSSSYNDQPLPIVSQGVSYHHQPQQQQQQQQQQQYPSMHNPYYPGQTSVQIPDQYTPYSQPQHQPPPPQQQYMQQQSSVASYYAPPFQNAPMPPPQQPQWPPPQNNPYGGGYQR